LNSKSSELEFDPYGENRLGYDIIIAQQKLKVYYTVGKVLSLECNHFIIVILLLAREIIRCYSIN